MSEFTTRPKGLSRRQRTRLVQAAFTVTALLLGTSPAPQQLAIAGRLAGHTPVAIGFDGAVATVDSDATRVGIDVMRSGGNAVDAAIATAAALGVTEPLSGGLGGGGFLLYYDARTRGLHSIDGRETAPASARDDLLVNPGTGRPYHPLEARVSGLSVGVPGTGLLWQTALRRWGTISLREALSPAILLARRGFTVDQVFHDQVAANLAAFDQFDATRTLFLPGGRPPVIGYTLRNPDLAATYQLLADQGMSAFYTGPLAADIVSTVRRPPVSSRQGHPWPYPIRPGGMRLGDLARYQVRFPQPTRVSYRGLDVYGVAPPSSGGSTVGEALNIVGRHDLSALDRVQSLHLLLEASALAFADRNRYVGDDTPRWLIDQLLSRGFATERSCLITPNRALPKPAGPGKPDGSYQGCPRPTSGQAGLAGQSTTHLTTADRWGNTVAYTFTLEQLGGNAMVVPGRGFPLNNELTDFQAVSADRGVPDPNLPGAGKRPRSSMAPTIVTRSGRPWLAVGSPGGTTIITTVLQILVNRIDFAMTLPEAIAAPRASQRNTPAVTAEPAFLDSAAAGGLMKLGHRFELTAEIGAATAIELLPGGALLAATEPLRRGGGTAGVVRTPAAGTSLERADCLYQWSSVGSRGASASYQRQPIFSSPLALG